MRAWCPRCDAVRPGETTCPVCATPLATLDDTAAGQRPADLPPPPDPAPDPPPSPSRLRLALVAATLVVAGLAFVAGRSIARPAAPPAGTAAAPATSTTAPEPGADFRELGWTVRRGRLTVTAVKAERLAVEDRETVAELSFRIQGLPPGQQVLALRGLRLLDSGGGVFASVDNRQFGEQGAAPIWNSDRQPSTFTVLTGPAPRLSALARIELEGLLMVRPRDQTITIDTAGPWPARPPLRAVDPGPRDSVRTGLGFERLEGVEMVLRVTAAFVGGGRATVVVDAASGYLGVPGEFLPLSAQLRAGDRVLCTRTTLLGEEGGQVGLRGLVIGCPTAPVPQLTLALGVGVATVPFDAALRP
jgi:hypothetical protein